MKKLTIFLFVLIMVCMALPAGNGGSFTFGYAADVKKDSSGSIYMYAGPNMSLTTLGANGRSSDSGFYNHLSMTLVTQMLTAKHEWVNMDLSERLYLLIHELAGIGFIIPVVPGFDVVLGAGVSYDVNLFSISDAFLMETILGIGIGADLRFHIGETFCISLGAQTSYSIWGEEFYFSSSYSDSYHIDFSKVRRYSGVKAKLGLAFTF